MRRKRTTTFIDKVLYSLLKRKGERVTFVRHTESLNYETGKKATVNTPFEVRQAILLPDNLDRRFVYDLAYIATNKNFTYGALFDTSNRKIIVRTKDLNGYIPEISDYMLFEATRWDIVQIIRFEANVGYLMIGQRVDGAFLGGVYPAKARDRVVFSDSTSVVLN